jgi:hypothetical protein
MKINSFFIFVNVLFLLQTACSSRVISGTFIDTETKPDGCTYEVARMNFDKKNNRYNSKEQVGLLSLQDSGRIIRRFFKSYLLTDKKLLEKFTYNKFGSQDSFYIKIFSSGLSTKIKCIVENSKGQITEAILTPCPLWDDNDLELCKLYDDFTLKLPRSTKISYISLIKHTNQKFDKTKEKIYLSMKTNYAKVKIDTAINTYNCVSFFIKDFDVDKGYHNNEIKFKKNAVKVYWYSYGLDVIESIYKKID